MAATTTLLLATVMCCNFLSHGSAPEPQLPNDTQHLSFVPHLHAVAGSSSLTLWQRLNGARVKANQIHHFHILLSLMLSGQVEVNPGPRPPKYPCGECGRAVTYSNGGGSIACDSCDRWFHRNCLNMSSVIFEAQQNLSWHCCCCGLPNTSSIFNSTMDNSTTSEASAPGSPQNTSSPSKTARPSLRTKSTVRHLKTQVVNFGSMWAKKDILEIQLRDSEIDLVFGCETHLADGITNSQVLPPNYDAIRRDRNTDGHGGVAIIHKTDLKVTKAYESKKTELVAAKVECQGKRPIIVAAVYRPPRSNLQYMKDLCEDIKHLESKFSNNAIWIGGDLNLPDIDWNTLDVVSSQYLQEISRTILETLTSCNMEQVVDFPTRGRNTLELLITNRPGLVHRLKPAPGISDHDTIPECDLDCNAQISRPVPHKIFLWSKADIKDMRRRISMRTRYYVQTFNASAPVETLWSSFKNIVDEATTSFVPTKMVSPRYSQPWFTRSCRQVVRQKNRAYRKARKTDSPSDWDRYKQLQKKAQRICKDANVAYVSKAIDKDFEMNSKKFYGYIRNKRTDNNGVSPLRENGILHHTPKAMADCLNRQFGSVFSPPTDSPPDMGPSPHPDMPPINITVNGVKLLLEKQKPNKAAGPDQIQARVLKEAAGELAPALTLLFNSSYQHGKVPDDWRHAIVSPIYKAGKNDRSKPVNYRPISLTCLCCKAMEHIVCSNLMKHLDNNNILTDKQHGFRKKRSCDSQLLITVDDLARALNNRQQVDCILLDFSKAFDKVSHFLLQHKLEHYGVRGRNLTWITDFLANRTQVVVVKGETSESIPVTSGVPQGSVLGPALFLVYINDLPIKVKSIPRLFADDCILYRTIRTQADADLLQLDLLALEQWEKDWAMSFAPDKCKLLRVTRKTSRLTVHANYTIHGTQLELVPEAKYLGVTLDKKLNFNSHMNATIKKCDKTRQFLQRNLRGCSPTVKSSSYKTFVRPIAEYAAAVWDPHRRNETAAQNFEAMQNRAARFVFNDWRRDSSITAMHNRLQWGTLQERRDRTKLTILHKIINGELAIPHSHLAHLSATHNHNTRNATANKYLHMQGCTHYQSTFFPSAAVLWNGLDRSVTTQKDAELFQGQLALAQLR